MVKYGNMGGWKAIRTFNRDARVAAGQPPYSYKSRYASGGARSSGSRERWDKTANRNRKTALKLYTAAIDHLDPSERAKFESQIEVEKRSIEEGEAGLDAAKQAFFFSQMKIDSWNRKWPQKYIEMSSEMLWLAELLDAEAKRRRQRVKKFWAALGKFEDALENFINQIPNGQRFADLLAGIEPEMIEKISRLDGFKAKKNDTISMECDGWTDHVTKLMSLRQTMLIEYALFIELHEDELAHHGAHIEIDVKKGSMLLNNQKHRIPRLIP
jgi:hypothetical protein